MQVEKYDRYVMPILFAIVILIAFLTIKPFIIPLLTSAVIAYLFYPVFRYIQRGIKNKTAAACIVTLGILLFFTIPIIIVINTASHEIYSIYTQNKGILSTGTIGNCSVGVCTLIKNYVANPQVRDYLQKAMDIIASYTISAGSRVVISIPHIILQTFVSIFAIFYLLKDGEKIPAILERFMHTKRVKRDHIINRFNEVMYAVVFGGVVVALIQGIMGAIGFAIFGISSPLTWGAIMFLLALIPYIGTPVIWIPASIGLIFEGMAQDSNMLILKGIGLFIYSFIFVASLDNILKPKIIGNRSKVHPLIILMGILGGIALMGPPGLIVGPIILAMAVTFLELYISVPEPV